jgi:hypothetical protein
MKTNFEQLVSPTPYENQPPLSLNVEDSVNSKLTWKLTSDEAHNTALRQEFSFEHAPSVPLCLAILKLHSEHVAYPRLVVVIIIIIIMIMTNEISVMWKQNAAQVIPIVISSTAVIPTSLSQSLKRLNLHPNTYIQM